MAQWSIPVTAVAVVIVVYIVRFLARGHAIRKRLHGMVSMTPKKAGARGDLTDRRNHSQVRRTRCYGVISSTWASKSRHCPNGFIHMVQELRGDKSTMSLSSSGMQAERK